MQYKYIEVCKKSNVDQKNSRFKTKKGSPY